MTFDKSKEYYRTEVVAHQINDLVKNAQQSKDPPPEFQIVACIKNGMLPDGTFRAESVGGAEISIQANPITGGLVLIIEGPGSRYESWELVR